MDMPEVSIVLVYWSPVCRHIWHRHIHMYRLMHRSTLHNYNDMQQLMGSTIQVRIEMTDLSFYQDVMNQMLGFINFF